MTLTVLSNLCHPLILRVVVMAVDIIKTMTIKWYFDTIVNSYKVVLILIFKVYLVTGGWIGEHLDSTELLIEGATSWIISEKKLPTERFDLVGISINNRIFMIGTIEIAQCKNFLIYTVIVNRGSWFFGYLDEVVEFNTDTEEWSLVENLREGKRLLAASAVDINIAKQFCL